MPIRRGFTLIELLIVVAIIAILAAIAVPNFLEAQVRAKYSRFMSDVRSAATALEAYRVDSNKYPPPDAVPVGTDEAVAGQSWWPITEIPPDNHLTRRLTTPIAYITSLPVDIFPTTADSRPPGEPEFYAPHYISDDFNSMYAQLGGPTEYTQEENRYFSARTKAALRLQADPGGNSALYDRSVSWHIHSHGPDRDHDDFLSDQGHPTQYDPTNGTVSDGDIFYFGPGHGFTRR